MRCTVLTIGQRLPDWAQEACEDYLKRFPPDWKVDVKAVKAEPREGKPVAAIMQAEAARLEAALPKGTRRVILDERGTRLTSVQLAQRTEAWEHDGRDVALIIGGADGIDPTAESRPFVWDAELDLRGLRFGFLEAGHLGRVVTDGLLQGRHLLCKHFPAGRIGLQEFIANSQLARNVRERSNSCSLGDIKVRRKRHF